MGTTKQPGTGRPVGLGALTECPVCGGTLSAVTDGAATNFLCDDCLECWHVELGYVHKVDPSTCLVCTRREECVARWGPA
jgi:hypothetical protein